MSQDQSTQDPSVEREASKSDGKGGLLIGLAFVAGLVLLVALNMR